MKESADPLVISWFSALKGAAPPAVRYLVDNLRPVVIRRLVQQGAEVSEAEDIFMEVVEAIFRKIRKTDTPFFDDNKFESYFLQACRWHWYKKYRKKRQYPEVTTEELEVLMSRELNIEQELIQTEEAKRLWQVFEQLGADCQKVLRLFIIEEQSHEDIARQMGYSYQYAKKKKYRCFQKLTQMMKNFSVQAFKDC